MKYYILNLILMILAFCVAHSNTNLTWLGIAQDLGTNYSTITLLIVLAKALGQFLLVIVIPIIKLVTAFVDLIRSLRKNREESDDSENNNHKKR